MAETEAVMGSSQEWWRWPAGSWQNRAALLLAVAVCLVAPVLIGGARGQNLLIRAALLAILATSLNLAFGLGGRLSLAHAALYGAGSYAAILTTKHLVANPVVAITMAVVVGAVVAYAIGLVTMGLEGISFAIVSYAIGATLVLVASRLDITGGVTGISIEGDLGSVPVGSTTLDLSTRSAKLALVLLALVGSLWCYQRIRTSRFGLALEAQRDDPILAASLDIDVMSLRARVMAVSGALAGLAGALSAYYIRHVSAELFGAGLAIETLVIVVLGGAGYLLGPVLGAALIAVGLELAPFSPGVRRAATGIVLIVLVLFFRHGTAGFLAHQLRARTARRSTDRIVADQPGGSRP